MRELNTIQKVEKLNRVFAVDEAGNGGANHEYMIEGVISETPIRKTFGESVKFQNGARKDPNAIHGIVRDRLKGFQSGEFATDDNTKALEHIEIALMYMNKRVMDRYERNVLGTYQK